MLFSQHLNQLIKHDTDEASKRYDIPKRLFKDRNKKDVDKILLDYYKHIIDRVKKEQDCLPSVISKKEMRRRLGQYKIPRQFQVQMVVDMDRKGFIKIHNRYRVIIF